CAVILERCLWSTDGMVGGNVDTPFKFATVELYAMPRRVGIASPVFGEMISRIGNWLVGSVYLCGDVHCLGPRFAAVRRRDEPGFAQAVSFPYFAFVVIAGVVKKKNPAVRIRGVQQVYNRCRITGLEGVVVNYFVKVTPRFPLVGASVQYDVDIAKVACMVPPAFAKSKKVAIRCVDDGGDAVALIAVVSRYEYRDITAARLGTADKSQCHRPKKQYILF